MKLITTLNDIKKHKPCEPGWDVAVRYFRDLDKPIHLHDIIESNGIEDAIWCMRVWPEYSREWRLFAVWCARNVEHLMTDERSKNELNIAERFANGEATKEELIAAWNEAISPYRNVTINAAWDAIMPSDCNAAYYAARDATRTAARAAARATDSDAARDAARDAQKQQLLKVIAEIEGEI